MEGECSLCQQPEAGMEVMPVPRATRLSITPEVQIKGMLGD